MMPNPGGRAPYPGMPPQQFMQLRQQQQQMMMMMQRQQFPQQQNMYPGPMNPGVAGAPMGFQQARPAPPPPQYTQQMAQDFRVKQEHLQKQQHKFMAEKKKQMEQALKQRQFQEQQKRLREFSAMGGRKMNADSLIESIMGKTESNKPPTHTAPHTAAARTSGPQADDGFGDFLGGPVSAPSAGPVSAPSAGPVSAPSAGPVSAPSAGPAPLPDNPGITAAQHNTPATASEPSPQPVAVETAAASSTAPPKQKDLMSMMMECSDLTAPQKAKGFVKPPVKDVQPHRKTTVSYATSNKSSNWEGVDNKMENFSEMFTLPEAPAPAPSQPTEKFKPPKWALKDATVPEVYSHVLEAATVEGNIVTEKLYPILLRSNLARDTLGQLWALCNQGTPGQLTTEDLWLLLAMISVAQNNLNTSCLDILLRCPRAPIPNLGQNTTVVAPPAPPQNQNPGVPSSPSSVSLTPGVPSQAPVVVANGLQEQSEIADDFADFQSASTPTSSLEAGTILPVSKPSAQSSVGIHTDVTTQGSISPNIHGPTRIENVGAIKPPAITPSKPINQTPMETDFPLTPDKDSSVAQMPDFENFSSFISSQSDSSSSQSQGWTTNSSNSGLTSASSNTDEFADFASTDPAGTSDFADFQQAPESSTIKASANTTDKYSAIKALVLNKDLYAEKPKLEEVEENAAEDKNVEDDWSAFSSNNATSNPGVTSAGDFSDFQEVKAVSESKPAWDSSGTSFNQTSTSESTEDWASFATSEKPGPDLTAAMKWESLHEEKHNTPPAISKPPEQQKMHVDKAKSEKFFAHNLNKFTSGGFGSVSVSAFDLAPPDLPDMKDDEEEFDDFGTFQGTNAIANSDVEGISSLASGLDDFGDFTVSSSNKPLGAGLKTSLETSKSDSIPSFNTDFPFTKSNSNSSFTKEDNRSMHSLDLKLGRKEESPSGMDSQSVSSLEFTAGESSRKSYTPQDERSVASLELQPTSEDGMQLEGRTPTDGQQQETTGLAGFGDFNSAITSPDTQWNPDFPAEEPAPRTRVVSEFLAQGELSTPLGDRYGGLTGEPQDTDKHVYHWQRCLEKSRKMLVIATDSFQSVNNSHICQEIVASEKGSNFLKGIVEIYLVVCRIKQAMHGLSIGSQKLGSVLADVEDNWAGLSVFIANTPLMPEKNTLNYSKAILKSEEHQDRACGVCLLDVDGKITMSNGANGHKLTYGGRQYHATCANFWVNCVDSTLPSLEIPELL